MSLSEIRSAEEIADVHLTQQKDLDTVSDTLRIGIAGCGKIARVLHAPGLNEEPGVEIVALMDPEESRVLGLAQEQAPAATICRSFEELLAVDLDAVCICSPNHLHAPQTLAALDAGLHVLCEKPLAGTLADGRRMVASAGEKGLILHVNHSLRYVPLYQTLARLVTEGAIGEVQHVRCLRASGKSPDQGWSPGASWFVSKKAQGGLLLDIGIHMLDVMSWLAGPPVQVSGMLQTRQEGIDVPDNVRALISYQGGASGVLELSWTFPVGGGLLEVYGTEGTLRVGFGDEAIACLTPDGTTYPEVPESAPSSFHAFVQAVRTGQPSPTSGELGLQALAVCSAVIESHETGRFVTIPPVN